MDLGIKGKTALVTGAERGTGAIIAQALTNEGVAVITQSNDASSADIVGDITTEQGSEIVLQQLQNQTIDILVNNYGTTSRHKWRDTDTEKWLAMYQANVLSAARMAQGLMAGMAERGWGRIVNLGTIGSHQPNNIMPAYYAAKGALATMGVSLAKELKGTGVTVNTVAPGLILTDEVEAGYRAKAKKTGWEGDWEDMVVQQDFPNFCGRIARREEVADLVVFLCSERAAFINGQNIRIDGGAVNYV
ncbi:MAG: SDR family oxidoreductase [Pseudomonadota bacterium]|tara:strand:+ start:1333 stop:2073 length:741 start_codon:yes stop_codon:yes gene_type:complete